MYIHVGSSPNKYNFILIPLTTVYHRVQRLMLSKGAKRWI